MDQKIHKITYQRSSTFQKIKVNKEDQYKQGFIQSSRASMTINDSQVSQMYIFYILAKSFGTQQNDANIEIFQKLSELFNDLYYRNINSQNKILIKYYISLHEINVSGKCLQNYQLTPYTPEQWAVHQKILVAYSLES
ncbi:Hypothetical_protein [Hexamita inflata]|uniref:Hypothetical_protein n=1 Tax=Hexamita inflata TaxID=28002 RepID=A0ABP1HE99_9EUKA